MAGDPSCLLSKSQMITAICQAAIRLALCIDVQKRRRYRSNKTASNTHTLAVAISIVLHRYARRHSRELAGNDFEMAFEQGEVVFAPDQFTATLGCFCLT